MASTSLGPGRKLAHYEVLASIGAGGMGEVYRARDTKLGRDVAIKVLPEEFSHDRERAERFEREARLLAQLSHGNVATLHGLEDVDGQTFLVMELVEGETLAEALARGSMPVEEALPLLISIAEGLEAAHERGIVHRDLKPANIKIQPDGTPKILDFGLAKAFAAEEDVSAETSQSPTLTKGTALGTIMGTASYMSPEQARGKRVDKRTDVWAFGCCLYEALAGTTPFAGDNVTDILAAVVRAEPEWSALPGATPPHVRRLLRRCLTKDPRQRLRDIGEARIALQTFDDEAIPPRVARRPGVGILWASLALVSAALAAALFSTSMSPTVASRVITFAIPSSPSLQIDTFGTTPFAVSPDGRTIVFQGAERAEADRRLWVRSLEDVHPRVLEGTEGAINAAVSPDGAWVAFWTRPSVIKKVAIEGGPVTTVATLPYSSAAFAWLSADEIVAEVLGPEGIQIVSAHGGSSEVLIPLDTAASEVRQRRPFALRDRRKILYASSFVTGRTELAMFSLEDGRRAYLGVEGIQALGIVAERLVYVRDDGVLMAVPFDPDGMRTTGAPVQLLAQVASGYVGVAAALSANGTLVYEAPRKLDSRLTFLDPSGRITVQGTDVQSFREPRFSPDGTRIAVEVATGTGTPTEAGHGRETAYDLWLYDRALTSPLRLTRSGTVSEHGWAPDGRSLYYLASDHDGSTGMWRLPIDGSMDAVRIGNAGELVRGAVFSPDGTALVVVRGQYAFDGEVQVMPVGTDAAPTSLGTGYTHWVRVSPNGRLLAYDVYESVVDRVMVTTVDGRERVFVGEGSRGQRAFWAPDSGALFYQTEGRLIEAELTTSPALEVARQTTVMEGLSGVTISDMTPDGRAFLALTPVEASLGSEIRVAVNWAAEKAREWGER